MNYTVIINLLLLSIICVLVIDMTDAITSLKKGLSWFKYLIGRKMFGNSYKPNADFRLKPLDCSLCSTVWCGVAYLLYTGNFTISYLAITLGIAVLTPVIGDLMNLVMDLIKVAIRFIYKIIRK